MTLSTAHAADPTLVAPAGPLAAGQAAAFRLAASAKSQLAVDGCAPIELEHLDGERWVAEPIAGCPGVVPLMEAAGELTVSIIVPRPGTWRGRAAWGTGCTPGRAFPAAACKSLGAATSLPFVVPG